MDNRNLNYEAGSFLTAYINLAILHSQSTTPIFLIPMVVNGAFSAELTLKALLKHYDIEYGTTHNLLHLFMLLPTDVSCEIVNRSMDAAPVYRDWNNWKEQLILISNVFEEWRYAYETKHSIVIDTNFLQAFAQAASKTLTAHCGNVEYGEAVMVDNVEEINRKFEYGIQEQKQVAIEKYLRAQKKKGKT